MKTKWLRMTILIGVSVVVMLGVGQSTQGARGQAEALEVPRSRFLPEEVVDIPHLETGEEPGTGMEGGQAPEISVPWSKIVFQSYRDGNWEIYIVEGDGTGQTRLTNHAARDVDPRLNRGSTSIVFASDRDGDYEIYKMNIDGTGVTQLTWNSVYESFPAWSPDGSRIAFQSYRDEQGEIYVMGADGSDQTRLTWDADYDGLPAWSPDGSKIAFSSGRSGAYRIYVMNADGSGVTQLSNQAYSEDPIWSPDGSRIAYDADADSDGDDFQELWVMNADGTNQKQVYNPSGSQTDAYAGSWSPDGRYIAFTQISFVNIGGNWYWTDAYLYYWDVSVSTYGSIIYNNKEGWPDWQTMDVEAPTSSMQALPAQSPATLTLSWLGLDMGPSGLKNYDVQVRDGAGGTWTDWMMATMITSTEYTGIGGHSYYFRTRGRDNAGNVEAWPADYDAVTTIEAYPPRTKVTPLPAYLRNGSLIQWGGYDPGGSGIRAYDVQYRDAADDIWADWLVSTVAISSTFSGVGGHTYSFRSRATDNAQNVENWPAGDGDTSAVIYTWGVKGVTQDNRDTPIPGVIASVVPSALAMVPSDDDGHYSAYVSTNSETYSATWIKTGYGNLPYANFNNGPDIQYDVVLPPADDIIQDGGFENGNSGGHWLASGSTTQIPTDLNAHSGNFSGKLGFFGPPVNISQDSVESGGVQMVSDSNGVLHIVWGLGTTLFYAQRDLQGQWSVPQVITTTSLELTAAKILVDHLANLHIVWLQNTEDEYQVYYHVVRDPLGIWSRPTIFSGGIEYSSYVNMIVDVNNDLHVVWCGEDFLDESTVRIDYYYANRSPSGFWSAPMIIPYPVSIYPDFVPQLAMDQSGDLHIVVMYYSIPYYARRTSDGLWTDFQSLSGPQDYEGTGPLLRIDEDQTLHVLWDSGSILRYTNKPIGGEWAVPTIVFETPGELQAVDLVIDQASNIYALWTVWSGDLEFYFSQRGNNGDWPAPIIILTEQGEMDHHKVAWIGEGQLCLVWEETDTPSNVEIYFTSYDNGVWSSPQNISSNMTPSLYPEIGIDVLGRIHISWFDTGIGLNKDLYVASSSLPSKFSPSSVSQEITIPFTMTSPTLSFLYRLKGADAMIDPGFSVSVDNGLTTATIFSTFTDIAEWTHVWYDLSPWLGQTITLTFSVHQEAGIPKVQAYLDEVTVGSAHPDVWVRLNGGASAMPGEQVTYSLDYGNRGGAGAISSTITATLPTGLVFESASLTPTVISDTLVWNVGDLPAGSGPFSIVITATVALTATPGSTLLVPVEIATTTAELETANNTFQGSTFAGNRVYLPAILKQD